MKELYINGQLADLSPETAIGVTIQSLDIADIGKRSITHTNQFNLPKTSKNNKIFGNHNTPYSLSDVPYSKFVVDYIVDGLYIIESGIGNIDNITKDGYSISIYEQGYDLANTLKSIIVNDLIENDSTYATSASLLTLPSLALNQIFTSANTTPYVGVFVYNMTNDNRNSSAANTLRTAFTKAGVYISHLFDELETQEGITISGSLLSDTDFQNACMIINGTSNENTGAGTVLITSTASNSPYWIKSDFTALDLIKTVAQIYGGIITFADGVVNIDVFDDIDSNTPLDWSGKLVDDNTTKSFDVGYAQNNYIKSIVEKDADSRYGATNIVSNNLNLDEDKELFKIRNFLPLEITDTNYYTDPFYYFREQADKSPDEIQIFEYDTTVRTSVSITIYGTPTTINYSLLIPLYQLPTIDNYVVLSRMLSNTVNYKTRLKLTIKDIAGFNQLTPVKISELGDTFMVNKINNWNPEDVRGTEVELIKIT